MTLASSRPEDAGPGLRGTGWSAPPRLPRPPRSGRSTCTGPHRRAVSRAPGADDHRAPDHARIDLGGGGGRSRGPERSIGSSRNRRDPTGCPRGRNGCPREGHPASWPKRHHSPTRRVRTWPPPRSRQSARCSSVSRARDRRRPPPPPLRRPGARRRRARSGRRRGGGRGATAGPRRRPPWAAVCWTKSTASPSPASSSRTSAGRVCRERLSARWSTKGSPARYSWGRGQRGTHPVPGRALEPGQVEAPARTSHRSAAPRGCPSGAEDGHLPDTARLEPFERMLQEGPVGDGEEGRWGRLAPH